MMNPWVILGFVIAIGIAAAGGYYQGNVAGKAEIQQVWDKEKAEQYAAYAKGQEEARKREQELQAAADDIRKDKDAQIRNISTRATAMANSMRDREARSAAANQAPGTASTGSSACTGKELYREDGEFLIGIAREADELRIALKQCYRQYDAATQKVNE